MAAENSKSEETIRILGNVDARVTGRFTLITPVVRKNVSNAASFTHGAGFCFG